MNWKPISTMPSGQVVRLAKFPAPVGGQPEQWLGAIAGDITATEALRIRALRGEPTHWCELDKQ